MTRPNIQIIKSMHDGNFDKQTPDDTSGVSPSDWFMHFSNSFRHEKRRGHADTVRGNILGVRKFHDINAEFEAKSSKLMLLLHIINTKLEKYLQIHCLNQTNSCFSGNSTV